MLAYLPFTASHAGAAVKGRSGSAKERGKKRFEVLRARTLYRQTNLRAILEKGLVDTIGPVIEDDKPTFHTLTGHLCAINRFLRIADIFEQYMQTNAKCRQNADKKSREP